MNELVKALNMISKLNMELLALKETLIELSIENAKLRVKLKMQDTAKPDMFTVSGGHDG